MKGVGMKDLLGKTIVVNKEMASWRLIDKVVIFLHKKERVFYELNKTATFIWLKANEKNSIKQIIKGLISKFDITKKTAEKDIMEFVNEAIKKKVFLLR
jgi:hypothetical protein